LEEYFTGPVNDTANRIKIVIVRIFPAHRDQLKIDSYAAKDIMHVEVQELRCPNDVRADD
jgi:hypothetical protein